MHASGAIRSTSSIAQEIVDEMNWDTIGDGFKVSTSAGDNQLRPDETQDDVLTRADLALYRAKNAARNRVSKDYWTIDRSGAFVFDPSGAEAWE